MNSDYLYLFHGYGGENSLMPLAAYMKEKKHNVLVVDNQIYPYSRKDTIENIKERSKNMKTIYITSSHIWFDRRNYQDFHLEYPSMIAPVELLDFLHPILSVYYPHDLSCLLHSTEMRWLDLFNLILLPYKSNEYYFLNHICPRIEIVGWIKKHTSIPLRIKEPLHYSPVFFPSNVNSFYKNLGIKGYTDWFKTYIPPTIPLKMPGAPMEFVELMLQSHYTFLDSSLSVYDTLNDHNLIIGSGESSILFEAALSGIPAISLLDGIIPDSQCLESLSGIKGIYPLHPEELAQFISSTNLNHKLLETGPNILEPFAFERVYQYITDF